MANDEQVKLLKEGVEVWNAWRKEHSDTRPDLSGANLFRADLGEANLNMADLTGARITSAQLVEACA